MSNANSDPCSLHTRQRRRRIHGAGTKGGSASVFKYKEQKSNPNPKIVAFAEAMLTLEVVGEYLQKMRQERLKYMQMECDGKEALLVSTAWTSRILDFKPVPAFSFH